ncbi:putative transcriptional regulator [Methylobacter tundripaludum]|uniref:Putative transcriptional regulator n=1 Tax=Methylobacter tundripaludum TaxID=173365 RepID=A0A2S6GG07_9GAMM|nr:ribbon-helix-helix domain-containing protein [Methylobacter tundripaludum]PPK64132.1 putative transcriptional regulator [Methylobacter tundripaludum]
MNTKVISAHVPEELADKVDQIAARLDRSRGWVIKQALADWLGQEEERRRLTLEALADVDAGHVIDHQAVQAWANSLDTDGRYRFRADALEMDWQSAGRSSAAL